MAVVSLVLVASSKANLPERNHRLLFAQNTLRYRYRCEPTLSAKNAEIADCLIRLTHNQKN
jgi:hypothetical protein